MDQHTVDIIFWLILGGLVGWIAAMLVTKATIHTYILSIGSGSLASIVTGGLAADGSIASTQGFVAPSFFVALLGALVVTSLLTFALDKIDHRS